MIATELEAEKLLRWAFSICNDVSKSKTYASRFPEATSLSIEIENYFDSKRNKGECTCQKYESGLVADDCPSHG